MTDDQDRPQRRGRPAEGEPARDRVRPGRAEPTRVTPSPSRRSPRPAVGTPPSRPVDTVAPDPVDEVADEMGYGDESATGLARDSDSAILKTGGSIAIATLASRITGFFRTVLVLAMLGPALASAFQAAYVLPNMIAEVVLGAVLTAIVIPVLVRAEAEDEDGGRGFINRIFTLTLVILGAATVIALIAAPVLTYLNVGDGDVDRPLTTALAYLLLPEILFYGLSALFIAILNMKGLFKPGAWAPVLNNIIQITTLVLYYLMPGEISLNPVRMTDPQLLVLGLGTTAGVVLQALILLPFLRKAGVKLSLQWGLDARLRRFGNMALAIVTYVAILQVGLIVTYRIAAHADAAGISVYATHWQLLQLPYGVLGVTILTAIMPRLSRNAAAEDTNAVVDDMSLATRLTLLSLVPVVAFMTFFGPALGIAVFNFGRFNAETADQLGTVLAWGAFTLIPYALTLVQLRVFYAREDAWTPTAMVLGITVVKVASSYAGQFLFSDPQMVVRWLALSNGLGYAVGAIVGHYLLKRHLGYGELTNVRRTAVLTLQVSLVTAGSVWLIARLSGMDRMSTEAGKVGSVAYLAFTGIVVLGIVYTLLSALKLPDMVAITASVQRVAGRFIPALAPAAPPPETTPAITVQFPRVTTDESLPYSGQVQVLRRFDRGTATWQAYSVTSGGAAGFRGRPRGPEAAPPPKDLRYRRRGEQRVTDSQTGPGRSSSTPDPGATSPTPPPAKHSTAPSAPPSPRAGRPGTPMSGPRPGGPAAPRATPPPRRRGPRLIPGAAVAGGRYRLMERHGGVRGLQFWRAKDTNLDRDVALTFVDAEQAAPQPAPGRPTPTDGPQAVLSRTLGLGQINAAGVARVLDVVRGSSGGIVVSEWVHGSSLADVARSEPSPIGAARAVRALAAAAEAAHRLGGALSIDHPDRIRISTDGNAVLAFPGTLADADRASDVRGLGAVLYALLLCRWPLDGATGRRIQVAGEGVGPVGGLAPASPGKTGADGQVEPVEPRIADPNIPFEISAVAARALQGDQGIRTAATVQHVLDQATVSDLATDALPLVGERTTDGESQKGGVGAIADRRNTSLLIGLALFAVFVIAAVIIFFTNAFGGGSSTSDIDSIIDSPETTAVEGGDPEAADTPAAVPVTPDSLVVSLGDGSTIVPANLDHVLSGATPAWRTDIYATANFGGARDGIGLMFDLGSERSVRTVEITTPTTSFDVSLRTAGAAAAPLSDTVEIAAGTVDEAETTLVITEPRAARYFLVWLEDLPSTDVGYQAVISEVTLTADPA